jgi:hypothetical protein
MLTSLTEILQEDLSLTWVTIAAMPIRCEHLLGRSFYFSCFIQNNLSVPALYTAKALVAPALTTNISSNNIHNTLLTKKILMGLPVHVHIFIRA